MLSHFSITGRNIEMHGEGMLSFATFTENELLGQVWAMTQADAEMQGEKQWPGYDLYTAWATPSNEVALMALAA